MAVIRLDNLTKSFGAHRALDGLTVSFPGGAMGLLGPNGAGKTTLLKTLLGLLEADLGTAEVLGLDATRNPLLLRRRIGYMPESDCYIPGLTGVRFVAYTARLTGMPKGDALTRAHEVLYYVGLGEARYRLADEYSQGMRQRLRLAQALVHDPDLLFLDEPTSGMDPGGRRDMLDLITDLAGAPGKHIVLSSHLLPDVEEVCPFVAVLSRGRIAMSGTVSDLRERSADAFAVRVKGDVSAFSRRLTEAGGEIFLCDGDRLSVRVATGPMTLFAAAHDTGTQIRELREVTSSLEETFLRALESAGDGTAA